MFLIVVYSITFALGLVNTAFGSFRLRLVQLLLLAAITPLFVANFYIEDLPEWFDIFLHGLIPCVFVWEIVETVGRLKTRIGRKDHFRELRKNKGPYMELLKACYLIARTGKGALIVVENKDSLEEWVQKGILLDARINAQLITSIFASPASLHDGAMIVRGGRIVAGSVVIPLTESRAIPHEFGTRHRAALGLSEKVDAASLIVSEETSVVSIAYGGKLYYNLAPEKVSEVMSKLALGKKVNLKRAGKSNAVKEASPLVVASV